MHKKHLAIIILLIVPSLVYAQSKENPVEEFLFAPELVIGNQQAIGLTTAQEADIKAEIVKIQTDFTTKQLELGKQAESLRNILKREEIDEQAAEEQLRKVLLIEQEIKRLSLGLLIRIRNHLTPEQRTKLRAIKQAR